MQKVDSDPLNRAMRISSIAIPVLVFAIAGAQMLFHGFARSYVVIGLVLMAFGALFRVYARRRSNNLPASFATLIVAPADDEDTRRQNDIAALCLGSAIVAFSILMPWLA